MPERDGFEGNSQQADKVDGGFGDFRQTTDDNSGKNESAPMSVDFSIFGLKPPNRPTINRYNSIDRLINSKGPNSL